MIYHIPHAIPVYYDNEFYNKTEYRKIDPEYTKMFKTVRSYKSKRGGKVVWILAKKSITLENIAMLEKNGWRIVGVENKCDVVDGCKQDLGSNYAHIKLTIEKRK